MAMELVIKSAEVNLPQEIENLEALKQELVPRLEKYKVLVVTEDSIRAAKEDKANLNKLKKAIEEQRISIKKQFLEPYNILEAQCKEVIALIDEPIKAIDIQIKKFDEIEKKEKLSQLQTAFYKTEHPDWLQFQSICPEKWENKTAKADKLIEQIQQNVDRINADIKEITMMYDNSPLLTAILNTYRRTLDKSETLAYAVTLQRQHEEEQKRREEMERRRAEKEAQKAAENQNRSEPPKNATVSDSDENRVNIPLNEQNAVQNDSTPTPAMIEAEPMLSGTFTVSCTKSQLIALRDFMKAQGIKYTLTK